MRFPTAGTEDFYVSGFAEGEEALSRTAAIVDERVGRGRTVAFSFEPNFRAFTTGTQKILANAILGRDPRGRGRGDHGKAAARTSARRLRALALRGAAGGRLARRGRGAIAPAGAGPAHA